MNRTNKIVSSFCYVAMLLITWSCASPGSPDGGPYDETPPKIIGCTPKYGATGVKTNKLTLRFNEYVKIENASEKVVVSPPQIEMPEITASGKNIKIKLLDSLKENTTYSIDFSDAIVDNNEDNPLGKYAYIFSTGNEVDTMEISGRVLNAENLEPIKGTLVGLHKDTVDSVFRISPFIRVARTNGSGEFTIKGVAPGTYRIYALNDVDGDFRYTQRSEQLAFKTETIKTSSYPDVYPDTIWHDSTYYDSIRMVPYTHYLPDDVVLLAFSSKVQDRFLLKTERSDARHLDVYFTGAAPVAPKIKGLNFNEKDAFIEECSINNDTIIYWIKDTALINQDTLSTIYTYLQTDTLGMLVEQSDTIEFVSKISHERQLKFDKQEYDKWKKTQDKLKKKNKPYQKEMPPKALDMKCSATSILDANKNIEFMMNEPIVYVDTSKIHLALIVDSIAKQANYVLKRKELTSKAYILYGEWRPEQKYHLTIDSAAFVGVYGHVNNASEYNISIPSLDTYSSFFVNIKGLKDSALIVQLLNNSDKVEAFAKAENNHAEFYFVKPGKYYMRMFVDKNNNGKWDTGDFDSGLYPEPVYYYPNPFDLKAKWDIEQDWDVSVFPLWKQKPMEITKQKPDKDKKIKNRNEERNKKNRR